MFVVGIAVLVSLTALAITRAATKTYAGHALSPAIYPELSRTDVCRLAPGTYLKGTVLGQLSTLTAANNVQTLTVAGVPTGGTFRLDFGGQQTAEITYSAVAATLAASVATALAALSSVGGSGNVTVAANSGNPLVTFVGDLAGSPQPTIVLYSNSLTGGTDPTITVAQTTPGRYAASSWAPYVDANSDGTQIAKAILQFPVTVDTFGRHTVGGGLTGQWSYSAPMYIAGYFRTADLTGLDAAGVADLGRIVEGSIGSLSSVATIIKIG